MQKVVSFTIYGNDIKYYDGLLENLKLIKEKLPDFVTWIYTNTTNKDHHLEEYKKYQVKIIYIDDINDLVMARFFPIDDEEVSIMFSRDADSRVNDRDVWCMNQFMISDKKFHIIRDNYWHKTNRILAGTFGIKQGILPFKISEKLKINNYQNNYGQDEKFLDEQIYNEIKSELFIHSDIIAYPDEPYPEKIGVKNDGINFVGNVFEYHNQPKFNFWDQLNKNIIQHIDWHIDNKSWRMITDIYKQLDISNFNIHVKFNIYDKLYMAYFYLNETENCIIALKNFKKSHINEHIINNSNYLFNQLRNQNKKIIGTTITNRVAAENEIIIKYGNYHHSIDNLPVGNIVKRHAIYYNMINHDDFECHDCWKPINKIYILNLIDRVDRYMETCVELTRINAPLNKIHHYKAIKEVVTGNKAVDPHLGALKNHMDSVLDFLSDERNKYCLILEDDITFTSEIDMHQRDLKLFFERNYDFDILLITSSKYGNIQEYDDLVSYTFQECTTSSGYILSRQGALKILPLFEYSYEKMKQTGNTHMYAVDRYWSIIQAEKKFLLFNNKFGYQRCNYSSITNVTECHFD